MMMELGGNQYIKIMKLESYSISVEDNSPFKSPTLWGNRADKNETYPLVYFRKPKWVSEESFKEIVKSITVSLPKDIEIK